MEGLKLQTPVETGRGKISISLKDKIFILGSCFADNIGQKMTDLGFEVCVNPFGTIYNPVSVCNSIARLSSGIPFGESECVPMGAGAGLICSFSHHTTFARRTAREFLDTPTPHCQTLPANGTRPERSSSPSERRGFTNMSARARPSPTASRSTRGNFPADGSRSARRRPFL